MDPVDDGDIYLITFHCSWEERSKLIDRTLYKISDGNFDISKRIAEVRKYDEIMTRNAFDLFEDDYSQDSIAGQLNDLENSFRFRCKNCAKSFSSSEFLHKHDISCPQKGVDVCHVDKTMISKENDKDLILHDFNENQCKKCAKSFISRKELKTHIKYCIVRKADKRLVEDVTSNQSKDEHFKLNDSFKCQICFKTFLTKKYFKKHTKVCNTTLIENFKLNDSFKCQKCFKTFLTKKYFKKHTKFCNTTLVDFDLKEEVFLDKDKDVKLLPPSDIDDNNFYNLQNCSEMSPSLEELKSHVKPCYVSLEKIDLTNQLNKFSSIQTSNQNKEKQFNNCDSLICKKCCKTYSGENSLKKHLKNCKGKNPYSCTQCDKSFSKPSRLERHIRSHTGERPFSCTKCEKTYSYVVDLRRHLMVHKGEKPFSCSTCGKSFLLRKELQIHLRIHTGEKPFSCDICDLKFGASSSLISHKNIHSGVKRFNCPTCNRSFLTPGNYRRHLKTHSGEKPYKCYTCGEAFSEKFTLINHTRRHTGEKPFQCLNCNRTFRYESNLRRHLKSHSGLKPYKCDKCGKSFSTKASLERHLSIHSGVKPYECDTCGKSYSTKEVLKKHFKIHQDEEV